MILSVRYRKFVLRERFDIENKLRLPRLLVLKVLSAAAAETALQKHPLQSHRPLFTFPFRLMILAILVMSVLYRCGGNPHQIRTDIFRNGNFFNFEMERFDLGENGSYLSPPTPPPLRKRFLALRPFCSQCDLSGKFEFRA